MAKFRCRNNFLHVSVQAYEPNVNLECSLCDKNTICDEVHLLLECEFFAVERSELLGKRAIHTVYCEVFSDIMNTSCVKKTH